jgi:two-component system chemotaxis sensor kinase CheA
MSDKIIEFTLQFHQEAREILDAVAGDLLKAEADPENQHILNGIFRGIHTIKGSAGSFEMEDISEFTHHLEGILNALRDGRILLSPDLTDLILAGVDHIGRMLASHAAGDPAQIDHALVERFRAALGEGAPARSATPVPAAGCPQADQSRAREIALPPEVQSALLKHLGNGLNPFRVSLRYTSEILENGYDPIVFLQALAEASKLYLAVKTERAIPDLNDIEPLHFYLSPTIYVATLLTAEEIADLCFDPSLVSVEEIGIAESSPDQSEPPEKINDDSLKEFLLGIGEMLEAVEKSIISYEETSSREALNEIFRVVHTIKGDSDYIGLKTVSIFTHALESLLERLRSGSMKRTSDTVDLLLQAVDFLRQSVEALAAGKQVCGLPSMFKRLEGLVQHGNPPGGEAVEHQTLASSELGKAFADQANQYAEILDGILRSPPLDNEKRGVLKRCLRNLSSSSKVIGIGTLRLLAERGVSALAEGDDLALSSAVNEVISFIEGLGNEPKKLGEILVRDGKIKASDLEDVLAKQKPIGRMLVEDEKISEGDLTAALRKQQLMETARQLGPAAAASSASEVRTMRIDERKIEQFTSFIGELLIARNTYEYLLNELQDSGGSSRDTAKALKDNLHLLTRLTNDMHHGVMSLRMIPIKGTFQKFIRVVRDISRKQKKTIDLITDGDEIEIDKKVADLLSDPLVHAIRNACDHGIESSEKRLSAGKPEKGTIILRASREGSSLNIRIIDDGAGIDRQKLLEKTGEIGMEAMSVEDPALLDLIFMPGVSTKTEVTDLSGRGVGMDVVKTTVQSLGGTVKVTSEEGKGTELSLSIPMTMGINSALLVESQQSSYAIPLDNILETLKLPAGKMRSAGGGKLFHHRGEILPAQDLGTLLRNGGKESNGCQTTASGSRSAMEIPVVIVNTAQGKRGLIVDRLDKNVELAIKPVPRSLADIDVVSGVSIMGDGKILLVLNPEKLF